MELYATPGQDDDGAWHKAGREAVNHQTANICLCVCVCHQLLATVVAVRTHECVALSDPALLITPRLHLPRTCHQAPPGFGGCLGQTGHTGARRQPRTGASQLQEGTGRRVAPVEQGACYTCFRVGAVRAACVKLQDGDVASWQPHLIAAGLQPGLPLQGACLSAPHGTLAYVVGQVYLRPKVMASWPTRHR